MNWFKTTTLLSLLTMSSLGHAEMKALDDDFLSDVSGQAGMTLDVQAKSYISEVAYFEDGKGIALQGVRLSSAVDPNGFAEYRIVADVLDDGSLSFDIESKKLDPSGTESGIQNRFEVEEIRFVDTPGVTPVADAASLGGFFFDYIANGNITIRNVGNGARGPNDTSGGVYDIDLQITDGRLGYRTNGNEFFFDGMGLNIESMGTQLGATPTGELNLEMPELKFELSVDAIRFSDNPNNHGVTNDVDSGAALASYGSLWLNADMALSTLISAGGADGLEGLTVNSNAVFNRLDVAYGDDTDWAGVGYWAGALGITGSVDLLNMTVDILDDPDAGVEPAKDYGTGLALAIERLQANFSIEDIVLGETKTNIDTYVANSTTPVKSIGGLDINLLFADGIYNSAPLTNRIFVQAGGNADAGYQGLRLDTQLSLISPNNESNLTYIDDDYALMMSGLEAFVDGDITLDVTSQGNINGTDFYDGLRLGFEDVAFGYRFEGFRIAESTGNSDDLKTKDMQAAQAIPGVSGGLLGLGGHPSMEGTLNGHATIGPGGNEGQEGITINADLSVTDGTMAKFIQGDGSGKGLWLSGLNYDAHLRDMMLDVTDEGLKIYETERWSTLDVTDFRIGDQATGASFGRLMIERYEVGSERTISAGGAGTVCIGGSGADQASCEADSGRWEDRGSEGLTIATKRHFAQAIEAEGKRNRVTWEVGRVGEGVAPVNGSGMQLVFDNFTTNDGDGLTDDYGFRSDYSIDVARTRVVKKTDGPDRNGVVGNKGDEKIMNPDGSYRYVAPGDLTAGDISSRPVGLAVRTRTHFKELDFDEVKLSHPVGGDSTLLYGLKLQNFDITTDITATVMD